jgi:hypothetical protein
MPRYFYHVHGVEPSTDNEGVVLEDDEVAWKQATITAGEVFKDVDGKFRPGQEWSLEVTDDNQKPLYFIRISAKAS